MKTHHNGDCNIFEMEIMLLLLLLMLLRSFNNSPEFKASQQFPYNADSQTLNV